MLLRLLLILTLVPAAELILLLNVHHWLSSELGVGRATAIAIGTILGTGVVGAALARSQGLAVLRQMQDSATRGEMPATALMDGAMVLFGGALLLTPGYLTDVLGLTLLIPVTRPLYKALIQRWIRHKIDSGQWQVHVTGQQHTWSSERPAADSDVIDVQPRDDEDPPPE